MTITRHSKVTPGAGPSNDEEDESQFSFMPGLIPQRQLYRTYDSTYTFTHSHVYLSKAIEDPHEYIDIIHRMNTAAPGDVIYFHLNTHGGNLETGVQLINAMSNTAARVVTLLDGVAYSLGTILFLAGDEMVVNDNCMMMFHNFRGGLVGKGQELTAELRATVSWYASIARKMYIPFLTEDELERISKGEDIWMQSPEIRKRLDRMIKAKEAPKSKPVKKVSKSVELPPEPAS